MVNTRTDADLSAAVQNALQALLPQIRKKICKEFRTGSGSSNAGGNPTPVTIHTWLEGFNKLQEVVLSSVFPSSGAGALEQGVSFHLSDKYRD
nr:hypothetical protein [Tanacetum cinerariifolium]